MAKLTLLQCMNSILKQCGENEISGTASLSTVQQRAFDNLNKVLAELAQDTNFKPLETQGTLTLTTGLNSYTPPSDFNTLAYQSVQNPNVDNTGTSINVLTPDEFDQYFPLAKRYDANSSTALRTGYPVAMTYYLGALLIDSYPAAYLNGKTIKYRYFAIPTLFTQGTDNGTCFVNETYDRTLLCDYATWLTMEYMDHPKASFYYTKVFGDPKNANPEGEISKFRRAFGAPYLKARVTYVF